MSSFHLFCSTTNVIVFILSCYIFKERIKDFGSKKERERRKERIKMKEAFIGGDLS